MTPNNPLKQYFRQPSIYIKLPSNGDFYPPGAINIPETKEFPVLPMTALDEIQYRTPDALFSGQAVVNVIQSCIPDIKNAWDVPAMDMDTILVGIRVASYGHEMDFDTQCPACKEVTEHSLDLRSVLDKIGTPDYSQCLTQGDLVVYFKPMSYRNLNDNNKIQFEQQKTVQLITESENEALSNEKRVSLLSDAMVSLTKLTIKAIAQNVSAIKTPGAMVTEPEFIEDFLQNCDRVLFKKIEDMVVSIKEKSEIRPLDMKCPDCGNQYTQALTLDMANFFGDAS